MSDKKIIAVVGATGAHGGGLVRAILNDPTGGFAVRALTRDVNSAKALAQLGAEVVAADVDDEASLRQAFAGAHGVYCVTFFWAHFSAEKEMAEAANMARAAKAAGAKHVIWSTLEDTRKLVPLSDPRMPTLKEKYKVPHFDGKGASDAEFTQLGLPVTFLLTSFYWDNLIHFGMGPRRGEDGKLVFALPIGDKKMPGIAAEDIGRCAYGIFQRGEELIGHTVGIAGEHLTGQQMADALGTAWARPWSIRPCPSTNIAPSVSPGPTISATCANTTTISRPSSALPATWPSRTSSTPSCKASPRGWTPTKTESRSSKDGAILPGATRHSCATLIQSGTSRMVEFPGFSLVGPIQPSPHLLSAIRSTGDKTCRHSRRRHDGPAGPI